MNLDMGMERASVQDYANIAQMQMDRASLPSLQIKTREEFPSTVSLGGQEYNMKDVLKDSQLSSKFAERWIDQGIKSGVDRQELGQQLALINELRDRADGLASPTQRINYSRLEAQSLSGQFNAKSLAPPTRGTAIELSHQQAKPNKDAIKVRTPTSLIGSRG